MIPRLLSEKMRNLAEKMPVISLTGPRQSGKTVLVRNVFPDFRYVNLEHLEVRQFAQQDPLGFIRSLPKGVVIDEAQYAPDIFSYIQVVVDETRRNGEFILTGSQNFQLSARISQSLAGRAANLYLLPFSTEELGKTGLSPQDFETLLFKGAYPRIYDQQVSPGDFYPSYIENYVERDVRQLLNVADLGKFQLFIRLCASRIGQMFNQSAISVEAGVDANTIKRWFSILETSFITFKLPPYFKNYNKRLTKTPKVYFYDTGLACALLGIRTREQLEGHFLKGPLFENFIIVETLKQYFHRGIRPQCYYWRDNTGHEIDLLVEDGGKIIPVEIKSGRTIQPDFFKNLEFFNSISGNQPGLGHVIYGGDAFQKRTNGMVAGWKEMPVWSELS
ncbi:MAG: ATP-binding protein [Saprospiraceae bacterium]|nr:ATP-binding protein [Saprospiraceae bacterium]